MTDVDQEPRSYASRPKRFRLRDRLEGYMAFLALAPLLCAIPGLVVFENWLESTSLKHEWTVKGPACAVVAKPSPVATRRRKPMTMWYGEARFTRSFAAVSCGSVPVNPFWPKENYRVCKFNNPGAVSVLTHGRTVVFEPPVGAPATVTVRRGVVSCVVGGGFAY